MSSNKKVIWRPNPGPQAAFLACSVEEIFFGGSRGGGKSEASIARALFRAIKYKNNYKGIFIRRTLRQLEPTIARSKELYSSFGTYNEAKKKMELLKRRRVDFSLY